MHRTVAAGPADAAVGRSKPTNTKRSRQAQHDTAHPLACPPSLEHAGRAASRRALVGNAENHVFFAYITGDDGFA